MRVENGFSSLDRSPLRFDRMPDQIQHSVREGISKNYSPPYGAASGSAWNSARDERRDQPHRRSARPRHGLVMEDVTDLLARTVVYMLTMLGLLHILSLGVAAS